MARRGTKMHAYRQVLMRLRRGDSGREIARSGSQKTIDNRLQEASLQWDGNTCRSRWLGWGNGRCASGGVEVVVGGVNVALSAKEVVGLMQRVGLLCVAYMPLSLELSWAERSRGPLSSTHTVH